MTDEVLYHINFNSYVHCPIGNVCFTHYLRQKYDSYHAEYWNVAIVICVNCCILYLRNHLF